MFQVVPILAIGLQVEEFKKPIYSRNVKLFKIYFLFFIFTIGVRETNDIKLTRQQRRILEKKVKDKLVLNGNKV